MATSNFLNRNASNVFAVEIENDFDYDDIKENLKYHFLSENFKYDFTEINKWNNDRNFSGFIIGAVQDSVNIQELFDIDVNINVIIRSGYYSGVNLDWELDICTYYENLDSVDDITLELLQEDYPDENITEDIVQKTIDSIQEKINELTEEIENVFKQYSTPLNVYATFSNGETIYQKS
jgi:hypothetical protein